MSRYITCNPDQNWLLPPSLREELGDNHMVVFLHELVEHLDLARWSAGSGRVDGAGAIAPRGNSLRAVADLSELPDLPDS